MISVSNIFSQSRPTKKDTLLANNQGKSNEIYEIILM